MAEHPDSQSASTSKRGPALPGLIESLKSRPIAPPECGFKIFAGNAHPVLASSIARCLEVELGQMVSTRFANGESWCAINESIRGADVFIVQPTCAPVNDTLMELLIMCDAFRRASARRIVRADRDGHHSDSS